jgi:hypothetical protein
MKTIEQVTEEKWFKSKPFLVIGTGNSLKFWNESLKERFNIWTINSAIEITKYADICALHDSNPYNDLYRRFKTVLPDNFDFSSRYILTQSGNLRDNNRSNTIYVNLDCDKSMTFGRVYPCQNSTSLPFCIFHYYYPHNVYTLGIDDGDGFCNLLGKRYLNRQSAKKDIAQHNVGISHWSRGIYNVKKLAQQQIC